jgi:hypothetical protein
MAPKKNIDPEEYKRAVEAAAKARLQASLEKAKANGTAVKHVVPDSDSSDSDSSSDSEVEAPAPVVEAPKPAPRKRGPNKPKIAPVVAPVPVPAPEPVKSEKPDEVTRNYVKRKTLKIIEAELLKHAVNSQAPAPAPKSAIQDTLERRVTNQMYSSLFPRGLV